MRHNQGVERLGKYRLLRRLAVGGMAEVYLAVAEGLSGFEKRVVCKRLLPQHARDPELVTMFLDEARLVARLGHPNIAEVYDVGQAGDDYFFAMEQIDGCDLRELLRAHALLPLADAATIVAAVAEGLHHAHEQEVVHRDVSPSNVLVGRDGRVKLIDFGVAKWTAQRTETRQGVLKGKCAYMSPEQCRAGHLDRRSDLFSLGVLLYEVTTGTRPFEGDNDFEVMNAIVAGRFEPPSKRRANYPEELEAIVTEALRPAREERFQTAAKMVTRLRALELGPANLPALVAAVPEEIARPSPTLEPTVTDVHVPKAPTWRLGIAAGVVLIAGVVMALAWPRSESSPPPPPPKPAPVHAPVPPPPASVESLEPDVPKATKARKRAATSGKPVKVWDPDSPVPP